MKTNNIFQILLLICLLFSFTYQPVIAQEMTKDQWQEQMKTFTAKRTELQGKLSSLEKDIAGLNTQIEKLNSDITSCEEALFALLGVTREEYNAFLKELSDMESRVDVLQGMSDAQLINYRDEIMRYDSRLAVMAKHNIALIPSVGNRIKALQNRVASLMKSLAREKTYTVGTWARDRDCLWNIAKKKDIYGNAWLWPKIWQGNRDKIKDPDLIKPKWVLKIPEGNELTKEERSAANSYYRKKAAAQTAQGASE